MRFLILGSMLVAVASGGVPASGPPQSKTPATEQVVLPVDFSYSTGSGIFIQRAGQKRPEQWSTKKELVYPALSPSGSTIAVTLETRSKTKMSGGRFIALLENPGAQPKVIFGTENHHCYGPLWSPDGGMLMFNNLRDGKWGVSVINKDGSGYQEVIFPDKGEHFINAACWGVDGRTLFACDFKNLYQVDLSGKLVRKIPFAYLSLEVRAGGASFSLSPDGSRLLMAISVELPDMDKFEFPVDVIYMLDFSTGKATRLTPDGALASSPAWLPDGNAFLFHGDGSLRAGVYRMELESRRPVLLQPGASYPSVRSK